MQMDNSASNGSYNNSTSDAATATATATATNNNNNRSAMSSDSLDFFYSPSPYPFDSPNLHQPDTTTTPPPSLPLPLPLLPPPPPPPPPSHPPLATSAAPHKMMMLSCWNEERLLVGGGGGNGGTSVEGMRSLKKQRAAVPQAEVEVEAEAEDIIIINNNKQREIREIRVIKGKKKVALGLRVCQLILCFLSFFVMVSDKTKGWTGDSYYRYPEYRYLVGVNIAGCIHSGVEACDNAYCLLTRGISCSSCSSHRFRYYLHFFIDQIVAYLLMSATSAAATRNSEWVSNWGKDEFTNIANASICLSFFAFFAFAFTCLFSAPNFITT